MTTGNIAAAVAPLRSRRNAVADTVGGRATISVVGANSVNSIEVPTGSTFRSTSAVTRLVPMPHSIEPRTRRA